MLRSDFARDAKVSARRPVEGWRHDALAGAVRPLFESLEDRRLLAATLLKDIEPSTVGSNPQSLVSAGGLGYFVASEQTSTSTFYSVYRTDATEAGTSAVWTTSLQPKNLTATSSGLAYFEAPVNGVPQVWRTDGTVAGTFAVTNFAAGTVGGTRNYTDVGGTLFFVVTESSTAKVELWKSGGTAGTTSRVTTDAARFGVVVNLTAAGGTLFFNGALKGTGDTELWKSDGTDAGTVRVKDILPGTGGSSPQFLTDVGGTLYMIANNGTTLRGIWKSDGTTAGTVLVSTIAAAEQITSIQSLTAVGDTLYVAGLTNTNSSKLVKSDGTAAGTTLVAQFTVQGVPLGSAAAFNGRLYFAATTTGDGRELWSTDGTAAGTVRVADIKPGGGSSSPGAGTVFDGSLYFTANDGEHGIELWKTDGTAAGTTMVADVNPGAANGASGKPVAVAVAGPGGGPGLAFVATDPLYGSEVWRTDGTAAGTAVIKDIGATPISSNPSMFTVVGKRVFFTASGGLWVTDGAGGHTQFLRSTPIDPAGFEGAGGAETVEWQRNLPTAVAMGDVLYYRSNGRLWRSDGTPLGTYQVSDAPGNVSSLAASGDVLYFTADDQLTGNELWRSDGTAAGTRRVVDLARGPTGSIPRNIAAVAGGGVVFTAIGLNKLYRSDGTAAGTVPLATSQFANSYPATTIGGVVYITTPLSLWATDGTVEGTQMPVAYGHLSMAQLSKVRQLGDWVYFLAADSNNVPGLYKTNGVFGGTELVKTIGTTTDPNKQAGYGLTVAGDRLFFAGPNGATLWVSDGTAAGTRVVRSLPGPTYNVQFAAAGNQVYFNAGGNLWVSDGDVAVMVFPPGSGPLTGVQGLVSADGAVVFGASSAAYGSEPWVVDWAETAIPAAADGLTVTSRSAGSVALAWMDRSNGESGFRVERSTTADFATIDASVLMPPNRTSYMDRPLAAGTTYYYRVLAYSRSGDAAASAAVGASTTSGPVAPTALSAVATSATSVVLNWSDVADDETGYVVQRSTDPNFDSVQATFDVPANAVTYTDTTATPLNRYYYRVFAKGAAGDSDYATPSGLVVATPDFAPANVQANGVTSTRIDLKWTDVSSTTTSFRIERGVDGGPINQLVTIVSAGQTEYADLNRTGTHTWQYRVTAITASGWSSSAVVSATTTPPVLTTPVKALPPVVDGTATSKPTRVVVSNGAGYFLAKDSELWRTDGTPAGTSRVVAMTSVRNLVDVNGVLYFVGRPTLAEGFGIFRSDGTAAGTVMVSPVSFTAHDLVAYNGKLYFRARNSSVAASDSLWVSDGTAAGTVEVQTFGATVDDAFFQQMVVAGGKLYFGAAQPGGDYAGVYVSDGTTAGTKLLIASADGGPTQAFNFVAAGDFVYYVAKRGFDWMTQAWWRSDGTAQGTVAIGNAPVERANLAVGFGNTLYFPGNQPDMGWELFKIGPTDTAASSALSVPLGMPSSSPHAITPFGVGLAFFTTDGSSVTLKLTNAAVNSASVIKQIPAFSGSTVTQAGVFDGKLYFFVREPSGARVLYRSDGTTPGTVALKRFPGFREPGPFTVVGGRLTFAADDGPDGLEPWTTDGTIAGTVLLRDIANTPLPTKPDSMVNFGGAIYFTFTTMTGGRGPIYRTDGTADGTSLIFDGQASGLFVAGDRMYFTANDPETGVELWITDGTAAGTRMVVDLVPGTAGADPLPLAWLGGNTLIFGLDRSRDSRIRTYELWRTDGTAAGTVKIHEAVLVLSIESGYPQVPVVMNGVMYFNGLNDDGISVKAQLWRSDGTAAGTYQVKGFTAENSNFQPTQFTVLNGALYFYAPSETHYESLWRTDGTAAGTVWLTSAPNIYALAAANGALYFNGPGGLWRSDGTPGGTALLSSGPTNATRFTAVGGLVYFFSNNSLWKTDGTAAGTVQVRGLNDGTGTVSGNSPQAYLVNVGGTLFYSQGTTLWRSDGTFAGTYQVAAFSDESTAQAQMVSTGALAAARGDLLLFGMITADGGREMRTAYVTPPAAPTELTLSAPAPAPAAMPGSPAVSAAAAAAPAGVVLTWADHAANESGFVIERSNTADFAIATSTFFVPRNTTTYTDVTASPGDPYFYRVRAVNAAGASAASNGITTAAAKLLSAEFRYDGPAHRLVLRFSDDVGASLAAGDLHLRNLTTGQDVAVGQMTIAYDRATNTATVTFAGGKLADGRYRLTLASGEVLGSNGVALDGDANGSPGGEFGLDFFALAGDATRDGIVNFDDLLALAKSYNKTGMGFAQGDFTGDGVVNFDDLLVLAKGYNKALPPMSAGAAGVTPVAGAAMPSMAAVVMAQEAEVAQAPSPALAPVPVPVPVPVKVKEAAKPKVAPVVAPPVTKPAPKPTPKPAPRAAAVVPKPVVVVKKTPTIAATTFGTRKIVTPAHR